MNGPMDQAWFQRRIRRRIYMGVGFVVGLVAGFFGASIQSKPITSLATVTVMASFGYGFWAEFDDYVTYFANRKRNGPPENAPVQTRKKKGKKR